jgi:hypothetical protein
MIRMGRGVTHVTSITGLNSPPCYSGRLLYAGVASSEKIFSGGLAGRLPIFLTKEETIQN